MLRWQEIAPALIARRRVAMRALGVPTWRSPTESRSVALPCQTLRAIVAETAAELT